MGFFETTLRSFFACLCSTLLGFKTRRKRYVIETAARVRGAAMADTVFDFF